MMDELIKLMLVHFPFMTADNAETALKICEKNDNLVYSPPHSLLGYYRFYPELINVIRDQDFDTLTLCNLTEGPLVYVAVLITPGNAYKTMMQLASLLNARAYAFHRYREGEAEFHFFRNNRYAEPQMRVGHAQHYQ